MCHVSVMSQRHSANRNVKGISASTLTTVLGTPPWSVPSCPCNDSSMFDDDFFMMTSSNGKKIPRYWPFVRGIHRSPVNSPHKGQWRGALKFSLIYVWKNGWVNNREAGDLRRYRAHYDVIVMLMIYMYIIQRFFSGIIHRMRLLTVKGF